jgi:uncharacterized coiled-coil protein SlyX
MEKKEIIGIIDEYMINRAPAAVISQVMEFDLRERMVRVEESLKNLHEQFHLIIDQMNKRFDSVDKRFESMQKEMDRRFDAVEKRFDEQHNDIKQLSNRMFQFMIWSFGFSATAAGVIIAVLRKSR